MNPARRCLYEPVLVADLITAAGLATALVRYQSDMAGPVPCGCVMDCERNPCHEISLNELWIFTA